MVVAKFGTVQNEGTREVTREIEYYNLDMILSVGYRVKSRRGVEFRRWANAVLKDYILRGYALNQNRLVQLNQVVQLMKRTEDSLDAKQVLSVVEQYSLALDFQNEFISLTDIARYKSDSPHDVVKNWLRNRETIEFLGIWESLHNPDFKQVEFDLFRSQAGLNAFTMSPMKWIEGVNAIGIITKSGRYGGTFAHSDIAFEFATRPSSAY